jgi:predicted PurR-regulated permease PerM
MVYIYVSLVIVAVALIFYVIHIINLIQVKTDCIYSTINDIHSLINSVNISTRYIDKNVLDQYNINKKLLDVLNTIAKQIDKQISNCKTTN